MAIQLDEGANTSGANSRRKKYAPNEQGRYVCTKCSRSYAAYHVSSAIFQMSEPISYAGFLFEEPDAPHALRVRPSASLPVPRMRTLFPSQGRPPAPHSPHPRHHGRGGRHAAHQRPNQARRLISAANHRHFTHCFNFARPATSRTAAIRPTASDYTTISR